VLFALAKLGQDPHGCRPTAIVMLSDRPLNRSNAPPRAESLLLSLDVEGSLNFEALIHNDILVLCEIFLLELLGQLNLVHYLMNVGGLLNAALDSSGPSGR
jgi:hypothetical protein